MNETGYEQTQPMGDSCAGQKASREPNFREMLERQIDELERRLQGLEALLVALPVELPWQADHAMRELVKFA